MPEWPVLVVGAGPAGLAAGIALARHGVRVLVVDRRAGPSTLPRSTVISTRSMEILRSWGLEEQILRGGDDVEWLMWAAPTLARAAEGHGLPVGYPTRAQAEVLSPAAPACVPQDHLERVLEEHLRALPAATVLRRSEATLVDPTTADVAGLGRVSARYLIGADGVQGRVRAALGIAAHGTPELMGGTSVLFRAPLWDLVGPHRYGIYWTTEPGGIFLPSGSGDRWKYGVGWTPGERVDGDDSPELLLELLGRAVGVPGFAPRVEQFGSFTSSVRLAERFRSGDAFLIGDAAHLVTPRGGTGLNTALHDGYDLGWKLAWVLLGWAGDDLLDTYEAERRPIAEHNAARSADPQGSQRPADEELHADLGARVRHAWLPGQSPQSPRRSTLDLLGPGLTLFTAPGFHDVVPREGRPPLSVQPLDHLTATALSIRPGGALLVRPDGVPVGDAAAALGAGDAAALGARAPAGSGGPAQRVPGVGLALNQA
jgi:putative polyketide hydroxylase